MSDYKVPYTKILEILPHTNADRLSIARCYGFHIIISKDSHYQVGDCVVYVPIDSILPESIEELLFPEGSKIKLHNSRVRQIKIRGVPSQGMLINPHDVRHIINLDTVPLETDLSKILGITKYEPPEPPHHGPSNKLQRNKVDEHPDFHKYNGLNNIKWFPDMFKEGDNVVLQEKLHGCVMPNTRIRLANGNYKTIKDIVDNKLQLDLLGMNEYGQLVTTRITNWFNNGKTSEWLKITSSREKAGRGNSFSMLKTTKNHKFYNPETKTYIPADQLKIGQKINVLHSDYDLSYLQKQILIGKMLGDGSLDNQKKSISFNQSKKQEQYLDYTLEMLESIAGNKASEMISGYGTIMCGARTISRNEIGQIFEEWFKDNKKEVPENIELSPISLAFWYMDDGSLSHHEGQEDRADFATCNFSTESCLNLINAFRKLGIEAKLKAYDYNRIHLNAKNADIFFTLIAPYITKCMQYKLPLKYRQYDNFYRSPMVNYTPEITTQTIMNIEKDSHNYNRYDIETETHNYFANDILTHNSSLRASVMPFRANTLWKKIKKFLGIAPKCEYLYGSNNVQITGKTDYTGFYGEDVYGEACKKLEVFNKMRPGETVFMELIGPKIQKNYEYGLKERTALLFDVKILQEDGSQRWLSPSEVKEYAKERGFKMVPILYEGPYNKEYAYSLTFGPSVFCPEQKVREGIVVKAAENYDIAGNKQALKWISEDYLNDSNNSDFH